MATAGLTENHQRSLLASVQHVSHLVRTCQEVLAASDRPSPLNRYSGSLTPPQRKVIDDYLHHLHQQLLGFLDAADIPPPPARISAVHSLHNAMMFVEDALEEMRGSALRGYGAVTPEAEHFLDGAVSEMQAQVQEIEAFLMGASADVLRTSLDSLGTDNALATRVTHHARGAGARGDVRDSRHCRVSAGKSSLLNALVGSEVLPTGVLPMTSVPTRLRRGSEGVTRGWLSDRDLSPVW